MSNPRLIVPAVAAGYGLIATITALQAFGFGPGSLTHEPFLVFLADHELAILPWIPATLVVAARVRHAVSLERLTVMTRIGALALFGIAVVGVVNLMQAGLLTAFGTQRGNQPLEVFAVGLMSAGHLGYLWYMLIVITAFALWSRTTPVADRATRSDSYSDAIEVGDGPARRLLRAAEIRWIEARGDYVRIHARESSFLKLGRMNSLEIVLDPQRFARVHRSAIVNLDRVRFFRHLRRGDYELVLDSGERLRLARSRRADVLNRLRPA